jgi:hypothetical protein
MAECIFAISLFKHSFVVDCECRHHELYNWYRDDGSCTNARTQVPPTLVSTLLKMASPSTSLSHQPGVIPKESLQKSFFREQEY